MIVEFEKGNLIGVAASGFESLPQPKVWNQWIQI